MSGHQLVGTTLRDRTIDATSNVRLRGALARAVGRFASHRESALGVIDDPDALRAAARGSALHSHGSFARNEWFILLRAQPNSPLLKHGQATLASGPRWAITSAVSWR